MLAQVIIDTLTQLRESLFSKWYTGWTGALPSLQSLSVLWVHRMLLQPTAVENTSVDQAPFLIDVDSFSWRNTHFLIEAN